MSLDVGAEGDISVGPFSLEAIARIGASLDDLNKTLKSLHNLEEAYQFGSVQVKLSQTATSDNAGDALELGLGGPAYGRLWQVRTIAVGGLLWGTTVNGSALVILSSVKQTSPPTSDVVDEAGGLPSVAQYSTGQLVVRHPNHVRIIILTPTANTAYTAGGWATDMPDKRERIEASV